MLSKFGCPLQTSLPISSKLMINGKSIVEFLLNAANDLFELVLLAPSTPRF